MCFLYLYIQVCLFLSIYYTVYSYFIKVHFNQKWMLNVVKCFSTTTEMFINNILL